MKWLKQEFSVTAKHFDWRDLQNVEHLERWHRKLSKKIEFLENEIPEVWQSHSYIQLREEQKDCRSEIQHILSCRSLDDVVAADRDDTCRRIVYRLIEAWGILSCSKIANGLLLTKTAYQKMAGYRSVIISGQWNPPHIYKPLSKKAIACIKARARAYAKGGIAEVIRCSLPEHRQAA